LFLEDWLERHGNASLQDCWSFIELGGPLSSRQEGLSERMYRQDQFSSKQDFVAPVYLQSRHYMRFQRSNEEVSGHYKLMEAVEKKKELPWWSALDTSLSD